jgi:hypothetical protein
MIRSYEEKKYAEKQIDKLEKILMSFRDQLLPDREEQYKIMASYYVRKIRELREAIDEYTGLEYFNIKKSDLNIHIEGPIIRYGSAPISVVSSFLNNFRKTLQNFYAALNELNYKTKFPKEIAMLSDFQLNDFQPGSINLSLSLPPYQTGLFENKSIEKSLETYFKIIKWACYNDDTYINNINDDIKEKLMVNVIRTLPDDKNINRITFYGDSVKSKEKLIINRNVRQKIIDTLNKNNEELELVSIKGCVRELDLDKLTFLLRNVTGFNQTEVKCKLNDDIVEDIKEYFDSTVSINGYKKDNLIFVKYIEVLDS